MSESHKKKIKCELYNDNYQNFKKYGIPKAQLVIADIPYNLAENAYITILCFLIMAVMVVIR